MQKFKMTMIGASPPSKRAGIAIADELTGPDEADVNTAGRTSAVATIIL